MRDGTGPPEAVTIPTVRSSVAGVAWPGLPDGQGAALLGLQYQLALSEWQSEEALTRRAFEQLRLLLDHCMQHAPFWADRLAQSGYRMGQTIDRAAWSRVPIITRREIQQAGDAVFARVDPPGHGARIPFETSGSTSAPVKGVRTQFTAMIWDAIAMRDHLWHRRDLDAPLAFIRRVKGMAADPRGNKLNQWSQSLGAAFVTGPASIFDLYRSVADQATWLLETDPHYIHTQPAQVRALVRETAARGARPRSLRAVTTFGEILDDKTRRFVEREWGVPMQDMYSAVETGYMALQCPRHEHYHVQSEVCIVEVLDSAGQPCAPGQVGTVVVTPLHNFAMPLLRYSIGDYAELGPPCPCGRGLPVLKRVVGRVRNLLRRRDGAVFRPQVDKLFDGVETPILQYQVVENAPQHLVVSVVAPQRLSDADLAVVNHNAGAIFGPDFAIALVHVDEIARGAGGKFEDIVSLADR